MSKESEMNRVNLFTEAREQAGLNLNDAAGLFGPVTAEAKEKLTQLEEVLHPYPLPVWSHKYLAELRRIGYENSFQPLI